MGCPDYFTKLQKIKITAYNKKEFFRSQLAAIAGTALDYFSVIFLTELVGVWYIYSNVIGASAGAAFNFLLGRYWAFNSRKDLIHTQAFRYVLVATGSLVLNTIGLYLLTEFSSLHYIVSKIIVGVLVAMTYNYLLQKFFVFKKT